MKRLLSLLGVGICGFAEAAPVAPAPRPVSARVEAQDLVLYTRARPLRIRVYPRLDGHPLGEAWNSALHRLFDACDRNRDGALDEKEATHLIPGTTLANATLGVIFNGEVPSVPLTELDRDGDGRVRFDEVQEYYRVAISAPMGPAVTVPENAASASLTKQLFTLLDTDQDGRLTAKEIAASEKLLAAYDADEDECLTAQELLPGQPPPYGRMLVAGRAGPPTADSSRSPLAAFPAERIPGTVTQRLLQTYDRDGDYELTPAEAGFDRETFHRLDQDHNGKLSAEELDEWRRGPADLDVAMALDRNATNSWTSLIDDGAGVSSRGLTSTTFNSQVSLRCGRQMIEFDTRTRTPGEMNAARIRANLQAFGQQFDQLLKGRAYAIEADLKNPQFAIFKAIFHLADYDNDGKLTKVEYEQYFEFQQTLADSTVVLSYSVQVPGLFRLMDANSDGRVSVREFRSSWDRLKPLMLDGEVLTAEDIQPGMRVRLLRGSERIYAGMAEDVNPLTRSLVRPGAAAGPVWFRKMDRNGDGDVSRAEFLGTKTEYDAIDKDHDGLIAPTEAETFDREQRKK